MDRLQLSDDDSDDLWNSPSKRRSNKPTRHKVPEERSTTPETRPSHDGETLFDRQEAREAALQDELQTVRNINQVIEGLLGSLDRAKGNMDVCQRTSFCQQREVPANIGPHRPLRALLTLLQLYSTRGLVFYLKPSITSD
jgi:hypothetical protein